MVHDMTLDVERGRSGTREGFWPPAPPPPARPERAKRAARRMPPGSLVLSSKPPAEPPGKLPPKEPVVFKVFSACGAKGLHFGAFRP